MLDFPNLEWAGSESVMTSSAYSCMIFFIPVGCCLQYFFISGSTLFLTHGTIVK